MTRGDEMGAKTWMIAGADGPPRDVLRAGAPLDRDATLRLARALFPGRALHDAGDGALSFSCPGKDEILAGCLPGVRIVAVFQFALDRPSELPGSVRDALGTRDVWLHAMHSVVDWFAFAHWRDGVLLRSLSLAPDSGILEDLGPRMPFGATFWAGGRPVDPPGTPGGYPLPFHPLALGDAALEAIFGYTIENPLEPGMVDPDEIPLMRLRARQP
jgi:hypothetical protein